MDLNKMAFHPLYEKACKELKDMLIMEDELLTYYKEFDEKIKLPDLYGKTVLVTQKQFPKVYAIVKQLLNDLKMDEVSVFVYEDFYYGATAKGSTKPWIEVSAKTLADFTEKQLRFIFARELFKIKNGCVILAAKAEQFHKAIEGTPLIGNDTIDKTFIMKYSFWERMVNYSADCFGYMVVHELKPCVDSILILVLNNIKLAHQVHLSEFLKQAEMLSELNDVVSNFTKKDEKIPYAPYRIKNLISIASYMELE